MTRTLAALFVAGCTATAFATTLPPLDEAAPKCQSSCQTAKVVTLVKTDDCASACESTTATKLVKTDECASACQTAVATLVSTDECASACQTAVATLVSTDECASSCQSAPAVATLASTGACAAAQECEGCPIENASTALTKAVALMDEYGVKDCPVRASVEEALANITFFEGALESGIVELSFPAAIVETVSTTADAPCCASQNRAVAVLAAPKAVECTSACSDGGDECCLEAQQQIATLTTSIEECASSCQAAQQQLATLATSIEECAASCESAPAVAKLVATGDCAASSCQSAPAVATLVATGDCAASSCQSAPAVAALVASGDCAASSCQAAPAVATLVASGDCAASCDNAQVITLVAGSGDCAASCDATQVITLVAADDCQASCQGAVATMTAPAACSGDASFVAYGCGTADRIARAAAQAYLDIMMEMKAATGAEGCPVDVAQKTLAAMVETMQEEHRMTGIEVEVAPVSLGVVADEAPCGGCPSSAK